MKVLLAALNAKFIHSSLALRYLRAAAEGEFDVLLREFTIKDDPLRVLSEVVGDRPEVVGFSCYIWNVVETLKIVRLLKKVSPATRVVLGGPEVSYDTWEWMGKWPEVDAIVIGEGEATFLELLRAWRDGGDLGEIAGLAFREGDRVKIAPRRGWIEPLDAIPSPYRGHLEELDNRIVYFEASRGCPFHCQFCLSSIDDAVRYFSLQRVKEDLARLIDYGVSQIKFVDRTFNLKKDYALELFQFLARYPGRTVFQFEITADILRLEIVEFLAAEAPPGRFRFEIGVQSTNEETNRLIRRIQRFDRLAGTVRRLRESGRVVQHLDLIAGLPREDYRSFRKTFDDVYALEPDELQLGFLKLLRGTGLRARAAEFGYVYMDEPPYEVLANDVLPYEDVRRIKRVEDMVDKYWNSHWMDHTLRYLRAWEFSSAFDLYQELGDYWDRQGYGTLGYQPEDLFLRMRDFLRDKGLRRPMVAEDLLKIDYLLTRRVRPRSPWWVPTLDKGGVLGWARRLAERPEILGPEFARLELGETALLKHAVLEWVSFDASAWIQDRQLAGVGDPHLAVVVYPPGGQEFPGSVSKWKGRPMLFVAAQMNAEDAADTHR
ncbi:B12-binding domain-containing radical SAM protein [Kyrpidia tusciae]|uniref:Radical SAM domain protein n=1 Tax=Kyrpidia tusciae (strain DSM 2912 / NBRC 15312 / T2) TaxID=562970 RepID=D5WT66_KYRT2|nr:B12-binding domain-containing radical SAM protein [Kyrpidia tusciae]ADG05170.1 Radical SAM domain protein [Kyrpidia tusciae DSM 2912]